MARLTTAMERPSGSSETKLNTSPAAILAKRSAQYCSAVPGKLPVLARCRTMSASMAPGFTMAGGRLQISR
jgi:hypothetical protein